jgi:hypothetical protein
MEKERMLTLGRYKEFQKELEQLINKYSMEVPSDTPDFILSDYLMSCLESFNRCSNRREEWYGRKEKPSPLYESLPPMRYTPRSY